MPDFDPATCDLFTNACNANSKMTPDALFRAVIGVDENGCPFVKTNGPTAAQVVALTEAIQALTTAIGGL